MVASTVRPQQKRPPASVVPAAAFYLVIRTEREKRDWNQRQMASFLGVSQSCVARWETRSRMPSVPELARIGQALGVTWNLG